MQYTSARLAVGGVIAIVGLIGPAAAQSRRSLPPDTFDVDVLTAYRYGLNNDWAPASCFGRVDCPEDHRPRAPHRSGSLRSLFDF